MKHPFFADMGEAYPFALEEQFDRILIKIEELWDTPAIEDYFSDLLIDKRGGRKGFPPAVLADIVHLFEYRENLTLKQAERCEHARSELMKRGVDLTHENFLLAVETGDIERLDLLIRAGASIHVKHQDGTPPLINALIKGYTIIAQMLINAGVDANDRDKRGLTPLLLACGKPVRGYRNVAEALINKGAHINIRDALGNTPLLLALSGGTYDIAEMLIERGADISVCTKNGETPLAFAQKSGNARLVDLLLKNSLLHSIETNHSAAAAASASRS